MCRAGSARPPSPTLAAAAPPGTPVVSLGTSTPADPGPLTYTDPDPAPPTGDLLSAPAAEPDPSAVVDTVAEADSAVAAVETSDAVEGSTAVERASRRGIDAVETSDAMVDASDAADAIDASETTEAAHLVVIPGLPTQPRILPPAEGYGWRLALPAVDGTGLRAEITPGRRAALRIGTADPAPAVANPATAGLLQAEPAPGDEATSPRHAVLNFRAPGRAEDGLVVLVGHVGPEGQPAPGGFCLEIRGVTNGGSDRYAFEHPAARLTLNTAHGAPLPGGRVDDAGAERNVRVWPAADRDVADPDVSQTARFSDSSSDDPILRAWFRSEWGDDLLTADVPATEDGPARPARRLLVMGREADTGSHPFITVYEVPSFNAPPILAVTSRLRNGGQTRIVTVTTESAVHTLVQHLIDAPHITPDLTLAGSLAAVTRLADGTLVDAYLSDGDALVLPELTVDAEDDGKTSAYARP